MSYQLFRQTRYVLT